MRSTISKPVSLAIAVGALAATICISNIGNKFKFQETYQGRFSAAGGYFGLVYHQLPPEIRSEGDKPIVVEYFGALDSDRNRLEIGDLHMVEGKDYLLWGPRAKKIVKTTGDLSMEPGKVYDKNGDPYTFFRDRH